jgi:hypothetical protein
MMQIFFVQTYNKIWLKKIERKIEIYICNNVHVQYT